MEHTQPLPPSAPAAVSPVPDTPREQLQLLLLQRSGLFDGAWFAAQNFDFADNTQAAMVHWFRFGWRENRWPNPYFDPEFYRNSHPGLGDVNPLMHYIEHGEAAGERPVPYFDPAWYRRTYGFERDELALSHFLRHRLTGEFSPIPEFDGVYYLAQNPDVGAAGMDPMEHYLLRGFSEGRYPRQLLRQGRRRPAAIRCLTCYSGNPTGRCRV